MARSSTFMDGDERKVVWIVDDSPLDAENARRALANTHDVEVFLDAAVVVERLGAGGTPDVLVLDWLMPAVSGIEVCQFVRASEARRDIAILILTSQRDSAAVTQALAAGANDFLAKPYDGAELEARIASILRARQLLRRAERAEEVARRLLAHAPDALVAVDGEGRVTYANAEAERVFGARSDALLGVPLTRLVPDLDVDRVESTLAPLPDVHIGDQIFSPTLRLMPADFAAATTVALRNVTEQRRLEARRLDFYSIIAHDLRSPLSAMLLRTDVVLRGKRGILPAELINDIRKIDGNIRSMVALINDFLDLARLEGSGYKLEKEDVDLVALVTANIDDVRPLIDESKLTIDTRLDVGEARIAGDRRRLTQVLTNLLSNAVKFTPPGGRLLVTMTAADNYIETRVTDTGPGITPEVVPTLFQRYARPRHSNQVGTGLGLMIVREIIEAHGGSVGVESVPGKGSTFWFRLPRARRVDERRPSPHLLLVDDDDDVRDSLRFVLEAAGYDVQTASNGQQALRVLEGGALPSAVLTDLMMPTMNGWELIDAMRRDATLATLPVCVISSVADRHELPSGVHALGKPIMMDRLLAFVSQHCPARRKSPTGAP